MLEERESPCLTREAFFERRIEVPERPRQDLDRHVPLEATVPGPVHDPHPALADQPEQRVIGEALPELFDRRRLGPRPTLRGAIAANLLEDTSGVESLTIERRGLEAGRRVGFRA